MSCRSWILLCIKKGPPHNAGKAQSALALTCYPTKDHSVFIRKRPAVTLFNKVSWIWSNNDLKTFPCQNLKNDNSVITISSKAAINPPHYLSFSQLTLTFFARGAGCKTPASTPGMLTPPHSSEGKSSPARRDPSSPIKDSTCLTFLIRAVIQWCMGVWKILLQAGFCLPLALLLPSCHKQSFSFWPSSVPWNSQMASGAALMASLLVW